MSKVILPKVAVGIVVLNKNAEVLLVKRVKEPNIGEWSIPGGHQKSGEKLIETGRREVYEETGITIDTPQLIDVVDLVQHDQTGVVCEHHVLVDYVAQHISGVARPGSDAGDVIWISMAALEKYVKWSETIRIISEGVKLLR